MRCSFAVPAVSLGVLLGLRGCPKCRSDVLDGRSVPARVLVTVYVVHDGHLGSVLEIALRATGPERE